MDMTGGLNLSIHIQIRGSNLGFERVTLVKSRNYCQKVIARLELPQKISVIYQFSFYESNC